ncbi:hypothetical protein IHV12_18265 [Fictibacillus sp. 7GRE50]|uniref:hypothetical protein n=1 Tax=Fictibacillus sp. 7GRE50 TaxID=2745878 RepID=UPI0018CD1251|nr:hypothetical protein [Fictibacillus sp. 7GRE50]MBH0166867.1 hypothetical protein [Fictibacillus sp. 7GRE50]
MTNKGHCICRCLKEIPSGRSIIIVTDRGGLFNLTFIDVIDHCVRGIDPLGRSQIIDCECIAGIDLRPSTGGNLTLQSEAVIVCTGFISGTVTCNGIPVAGAPVTFTDDIAAGLTYTPNPAITDSSGRILVEVNIPEGTPETPANIIGTTVINGETVSAIDNCMVMCPSSQCSIELTASGESIDCTGNVFAVVTCGGVPVEGVTVDFSSDNPNFTLNPTSDVTDSQGDVAAGLNIAPNTPSQVANITASATIGTQTLSTTISVSGQCANICALTLSSASEIDCSGVLSGTLLCGGVPQSGVTVTFTQFPEAVATIPSATTNASGNFTTNITVPPGTALTSTVVSGTAIVAGQTVSSSIDIDFSCRATNCPCKFRLGVRGSSAPATANVVNQGVPSTVTGNINVTANQCYGRRERCDPTVDNFSISFSGATFTFNLAQGRRIRFTCIGERAATLEGTAIATGSSTIQGLFDVFIGFTRSGSTATWNILATNQAGDSFSTTFTSGISSETEIEDCDD